MWLPNLKYRKRLQEIRVPRIRFLGEQDGPPERELKAKLKDLFQLDQSVNTAYLAKVVYGEESHVSVALCLKIRFKTDRGLMEEVGKIFASMFGQQEHLDIVFLSDDQESELTTVCPPFFISQ
jgi:hypothetical protein